MRTEGDHLSEVTGHQFALLQKMNSFTCILRTF